MLYTAIGVGVLLVLVPAGLYLRRHSRSRQNLSTTEWVKLMRENDLKIAAAGQSRTTKSR